DKVIRREILIDEGDVYSSTLWDASILRLNQLGYFDVLKENESYELKRNPGTNTVDINLKVKEKGRNSIGLNGGVSGIAGTFIGLNYSTNNFLGLGETLSMQTQLGTLQRNISLGFTEPYLFDRPLQAGISVYLRRFDYNQGRQVSLLSGVDLQSYYNSLGSANVLNYVQDSKGIALSMSYPIKRSFARLGVSVGYDISSIVPQSTGATAYFTYLEFQRVNGPNALNGIKTFSITPSYSYNSKNSFLNPTGGRSIFFSLQASGSVLGANVNTIKPTFDMQYYHVSPKFRKNGLAFHFISVTPTAFLPSSAAVTQLNPDGSPRTQKALVGGVLSPVTTSLPTPTYQLISPGGDTQSVFNFEYRIPIFGPVYLVPFVDIGMNKILLTNQLTVNPGEVSNLNAQFPQAAFTHKVLIAPGTQAIRMSTGLELQVTL